ncbi:hypothetical protein H2200_004013 [Cladophialophora chaetospira]|uniref:AB hydrolase-1 domain-containing protein n=1 Tax=Cladophialophora chaetospira TaxID=386627 RepID=A0AA38XFI3_9EURO|nr:hypothetical protein H2200_004013 [Cladophialophora chaetospira]
MSKPSILLVPGSFVFPHYYNHIFDAVRAKGYEIRGLHNPTVGLGTLQGRPGKPPTMYDDASFIAEEVEKLADEGKDVILIGHSYAGIPVSQCAEGLGKEERKKQGKPGGLVNLAYLTCLVPPVGGNARSVLAKVPDEHKVDMKVGDDGWMVHHKPESTAAICFTTMPLAESTEIVKTFGKHSAISFENPLTYAGYKTIPCSYMVCETDLCIPPDVQREGIETIEQESGRKVDVTNTDADHVAIWQYEKEVIDWIVGLGDKLSTK